MSKKCPKAAKKDTFLSEKSRETGAATLARKNSASRRRPDRPRFRGIALPERIKKMEGAVLAIEKCCKDDTIVSQPETNGEF